MLDLDLSLEAMPFIKAPGGLLNPLTLSPVVWISPSDAATMFTDAGVTQAVQTDPVHRAADKSGNGFHFNQTTLAKRALLSTGNGKTCLDLDGADDFYITATGIINQAQPFTLACAALFENAAGSIGNLLGCNAALAVFGAMSSNDYRLNAGSHVATGTRNANAHAYIVTFNGASSALMIDGVETAGLSAGANGVSTGLFLGSDNSGTGQFFNGQLFEWMLIPGALSAGQKASLTTYLASKAGI